MNFRYIITSSILSVCAFCGLNTYAQPDFQELEKAPRPGQAVAPVSTTPQYAHSIPGQEQKRDGAFRKLQADTMVVNNTLTANTIHVQHFDISETTFENLDVLQTVTTKNLFVISGAQIAGPLDMAGHPISNVSTVQAREFVGTALASAPAALLTGQGTTQAPALRLLGLPNTPLASDTILTLDGSGNVINSGTTIGSFAGGTSSNVPGALVQRNFSDGGFSAGTITANIVGYHTGNVSGDVIGNLSGVASANVLKAGDTMTGMLHINNITAPALRLSMNALSSPTDYVIAIDSSGNITESSVQIGSLGASGTSGNVPGTLVLRNGLGNFAAGTITAGLLGNVTGDVYGNVTGNLLGNVTGNVVGTVSGAASANVLKIGDTMSGQLRITDASNAALVLTGQGTAQAPALRMLGTPNTPTPSDTILTLDGLGNVINSGATIGSLAGGTSSNVPNTLVLRDTSGNFATSAITLNSGTTGFAALTRAGSAGTGLYFPAAGQVALTAASTQQLVATSTGVGIGTNPFTQFVVSGPLSVAGNLAVGAGPHGIYLQGRYLYIANVGADTMSIVDVSNSNNPVLVSTLGGLSNPRAISVQGHYAYVTNSDIGTMSIVDISNPSSPAIVGTVSGISTPVSLYVQGRYAYVLNDATNVFTVVDISSPSNPAIVGTLGGIDAFVVRAQGAYAYTVGNGTPEMKVIDVSNPATPALVSTTALISGANDIVLQGRYAYVLVGQAVQIFDMSTPTLPAAVSTFSLAPNAPFALAIEGRYLYTVNNGFDMISVIDVSDPTNPILARSLVQASGGSVSLIVQGRYAYFVDDVANALQIVDLGGAYIQQLETGGIESGTLATRANAAIGNDLDVKGGATIGSTLEVNNDAAFGGSIAIGQTLRLYDATGADYVGLKAPNTVNSSYTLTLPTAQGTAANQVLAQSPVLGQLAWLGATSANSADMLVMRDSSGNFAAGVIAAQLLGNVTGDVVGNVIGNVSGAASANVLKIGDTMSGQLRIADASNAALVLTGQGTAQAPALRMFGTPNTPTPSDTILTLDGSGNVINSGTTIGSLAGGTSSNVPNTLVLRDNSGNFATSAITLNAGNSGAAALNFAGSAGTGLYSPGANQLALSASGAQKLYANSTGVGIGTSSPFTQFTVDGSLALVGSVGVGSFPVPSVCIQGRYAYTVSRTSNTMSIVDVSNPSNPVIVATQTGLNSPNAVSVQGNYAYVGDSGSHSLVIIDIKNPSSPAIVGTVSGLTPGYLYVQGRYAYVLNFSPQQSMSIVDVSDPQNGYIVGALGIGNPRALFVQGRYAYVLEGNSNSIMVIDVSNPSSPVLVSTLSLSPASTPTCIYVQGRYAYVAAYQQLVIIDVKNPTAPTIVSVFSVGFNALQTVYVQGRYAYVGTSGTPVMFVIDVSDPNNPVIVRQRQGSAGFDTGNTLVVQGRYAYGVNETQLEVIDLGGAYIQQLETGGLETGTLASRENVAIGNDLDVKGGATIGSNLLVSGDAGFDGNISVTESLRLYDATGGQYVGLSAPNTVTTSYTLALPTAQGTAANQVLAQSPVLGQLAWLGATSANSANTLVARDNSGNFATSAITLDAGNSGATSLNFAGSAGTGLYSPGANQLALSASGAQKLYANSTGIGIGTSSPFTQFTVDGSLTLVGSVGIGSFPVPSVCIQGRYVYTVSRTSNTMSIVDVSNPSNPVIVGTQTGLSSPYAVSVQGNYAYVGDSGSHSLVIIDIKNPSSPAIVGTVSGLTPGYLYVQGRYAYVLNFFPQQSMSIVDISDPQNGYIVGALGVSNPRALYVQGRYAYVLEGNSNSIMVIDVSNPSSPVLVSTLSLSPASTSACIYVQGRYAYVAAYQQLVIIDVKNPTAPTIVSVFSVGFNALQTVYVQGRYAYVGTSGTPVMFVVDVSDPNNPVIVRQRQGSAGFQNGNTLVVQGRYVYGVNDTQLEIIDLGGAYIQQLETGGLETGTLATRANVAIGNDLDVKGGATIGSNLLVSGDAGFDGNISVTESLRLYDATGGQYVGLSAPNTVTTSYTLTLPTDQGTAANQVLAQSPVLGQLAWLGATSANSANTLVTRDNSGNFAASAITLDAGSTGATALNFAGSAGTGLYSPGANQLALAASGAQKLYANSTGVGIGTSSPFTQFTVDGSLTLVGSVGIGSFPVPSVCVQGRYVYTVSRTSNTMSIVDVSNPSSPVVVATQTGLSTPYEVSVQGNYAYVADSGSHSLVIIDIKNPSSPAVVGTVSGLTPYHLYVQGRYAYVLNSSPQSSLSIVDISDPRNGYIVGTLGGIGNPRPLYVQGQYAYVLEATSNSLMTIDISNPSSPVVVGTLSLSPSSTPASIYVQGRYAYVAAYQRLLIIDLKNPTAPTITSVLSVGFNALQTVYVQGRYAYVGTSGTPVMFVIDVSDPNNPFIARQREGSGGFQYGHTLVVQGRYVYGVNDAQLEIIDLGGAYIQQLETGGLETGTLASRENVAIGNDLDVKGGATIGSNLLVSGQITARNITGASPNAISPLCLINVPTGTVNQLYVDASGYVTQASSSRRFKENIVPLSAESDLLYTLTPVKYDFNAEHSGRKNLYGFIAEEVADVYPSIVNYDGQGLPCNYVADTLHALTIKEVQKQKQKLDAHDGIIKALLITIASMQAQITTLQAREG